MYILSSICYPPRYFFTQSAISRRVPPWSFLLMSFLLWVFSYVLLIGGGQALGFCNTPEGNFDLNRCYINKDELNWIKFFHPGQITSSSQDTNHLLTPRGSLDKLPTFRHESIFKIPNSLLGSIFHLMCMFLGRRRNLEYLEKTHTGGKRTCKGLCPTWGKLWRGRVGKKSANNSWEEHLKSRKRDIKSVRVWTVRPRCEVKFLVLHCNFPLMAHQDTFMFHTSLGNNNPHKVSVFLVYLG